MNRAMQRCQRLQATAEMRRQAQTPDRQITKVDAETAKRLALRLTAGRKG